MKETNSKTKLDSIISWAKRRGFVFPGSEIYSGLGGTYDFGPLGLELKNNIKRLWWQKFIKDRDDVVGLESAILMNRKVWQASGHEKGFIDELVECKKCNQRFKADDLSASSTGGSDENCSKGGKHELTKPKVFNTMFKTDETYLRPETAAGMFCDFKAIAETSRLKIPFGIAQIGKVFRNEINTKDFLFRVREFEIAEIEYFVEPKNDEAVFEDWLKNWQDFVMDLGIKKENLKLYDHPKDSLAHYSKRTCDILYQFPFSWKELAGIANRTDFDLKSHEKFSGKDLKYFDESSKKKYWPYVIEPTMGIERLMLAILCDAFEETKARTETTKAATEQEIVLKISSKIAPIQIAVLPLVKKLSKEAKRIYQDLKKCYSVYYDESGSIGRRYRRQDEIGTPFCLTFDFDSLDDKKVTIRDRDTMKQERIEIKELNSYFWEKLK